MKIRQLHIKRFGHFSEFKLEFPGDGLQVICGPNEAGKTTLLEFVRGLLFDFPVRTPYDFGGPGEMAGEATFELRDGRAVELRRRKGTRDKVKIKLDGQPTSLDDAGWSKLLDHADRGLFESVFAFGLDQLSQGEASLKHESLQSALFGGSLGSTNSPDKIVAELSRQAEELFKKAGSKPTINALLAELKKLSKEIKDRSLRPEKYHELEATVTSAAQRAQSLHDQVDRIRREHARIEKRVRAWPKWWELQQRRSDVEQAARLLNERGEITGEPPVLRSIPPDARQRYQALCKALKSLADDQSQRQHEIEQAERSLAALQLDPRAVSYRAEIKSCLELRQSFIEAQQHLPERERQRDAIQRQIDRELAELRSGWTHDDLRAFAVDVATRAELDRLSKERRERTISHTTLATKRDGDASNLDRARDDLAEIGLPRDVTALEAVLADEADFVANRKQLEATGVELTKLDRKLATQCRKLTPPLSVADLPDPRSHARQSVGTAELPPVSPRSGECVEKCNPKRQRGSLDCDFSKIPTLADASGYMIPTFSTGSGDGGYLELPVPRRETVSDFETRFADVREKVRSATASWEQDDAERREIEKSLATAMSRHVVPSLGERDVVRSRRDAGWQLVRQKYIAGEPADAAIAAWINGANSKLGDTGEPEDVSPRTSTNVRGLTPSGSPSEFAASLPDGYEQAVRVADNIADQIYDNANEVAEREGLRRQLAALATRLDQKRERIAALDQQQVELQTKWLMLWQPCGFEPLAPDAMLGWLNDHEAVCATIAQRDELLEAQSRRSQQVTAFEQRLRAAVGTANAEQATRPPVGAVGVTGEPPVLRLLQLAKQEVDDAKDRQRRKSELQKEIRRLEKQLAKYDAELQSLATRATTANAEWQAVLSRLNLPTHWDAELAREVIDKLSATRVRLDGLPGEQARIDAMQARIQEFDQRVRSLCEALAPELLRLPAELASDKLSEQVEQAVEAQRRHDELSRKLAAAREQLRSLNDRHNQQDSERASLFALANATNETEFLEVVARTEKVIRLDSEIEQLQREIDLIRAGDEREEFEASIACSERTVLEGEQRDLGEQLRQQEQLKREADEAVGAARKELAQLDGSGQVASLNEELSRKRSQLAAEVDRYLPLVYARHLLNAAVSRFEKENQPEMIATVSRLLGQMTDGKYIGFDKSGGGQSHVLIRRSDGVERTPDQLSTGTREQLYLAIRLAYVLHYCEKSQPLPIIIDDVLVNFDERRTRQTLSTLADIAKSAQVLFFTCHPHLVALARDVVPGLTPINLPSS